MDLTALQSLGGISLVIPAWQMAAYVGVVSIFLLLRRLQLCLLANYVFVLHLGFLVYAPSFIGAAGGNTLTLTLYPLCGLAVAGLALVAFFQHPT